MRTYRLELILNERDLIAFLDQNPGYKPTVEGIREAGAEDAATDVWRPNSTRKPRSRRPRTAAPAQVAAE